MGNYKFTTLFIFCSWVIFIASGRDTASSVILTLSGLYALCDTIPKLKDIRRNAER